MATNPLDKRSLQNSSSTDYRAPSGGKGREGDVTVAHGRSFRPVIPDGGTMDKVGTRSFKAIVCEAFSRPFPGEIGARPPRFSPTTTSWPELLARVYGAGVPNL